MTTWLSRSAGRLRSTSSRKVRNSRARCRFMQLAVTEPVATPSSLLQLTPFCIAQHNRDRLTPRRGPLRIDNPRRSNSQADTVGW